LDTQTPQYVAPAPDPALATLQANTDKQRQDATQTDLEALNARHAMMYGTRVALAGAGGATGSWFTPNVLGRGGQSVPADVFNAGIPGAAAMR
jgi:hypothetical protein